MLSWLLPQMRGFCDCDCLVIYSNLRSQLLKKQTQEQKQMSLLVGYPICDHHALAMGRCDSLSVVVCPEEGRLFVRRPRLANDPNASCRCIDGVETLCGNSFENPFRDKHIIRFRICPFLRFPEREAFAETEEREASTSSTDRGKVQYITSSSL